MLSQGTSTAEHGFFRSIHPQFPVTPGTTPLLMTADSLEPVARIAKMHYAAPVIVGAQNPRLANFIAHYWGIVPIYCPSDLSQKSCMDFAYQEAVRLGVVQNGAPVIRLT